MPTYPTFQLSSPIQMLNPHPASTNYGDPANRFVFWNTLADAKAGIITSFRYKGLTVGILEAGKVIEYWFQAGILDGDLVPKNDLSSKQDKLNALISGGVITLGDFDGHADLNDIKVSPATWYIKPFTQNFATTVDTVFEDIALCAAGLLRYEEIVGNTAGQIIRKTGNESTSPSRPSIDPITEVSLGWLLISDVVIETANVVVTGFIPLTGSTTISGALSNSGATSESSVDLANNNYTKLLSNDFVEGESSIYLEGNAGHIVISTSDTAITDISRSISIKKNEVFNISGDIAKYTDALDTSTNTVMTKELIEDKIDAEPFALITKQYADDHYISSSSGGGSQSIELTVVAFQALNGSYSPSTTYKITGVDINLYNGTTIYLTTNNESIINTRGIGKFVNPIYPKVIGFNIWDNVSTYDIPVITSGVFENFEDITTNIPTITGKLVSTIYSSHFIAISGDWTDIGITEIIGVNSNAHADIDVSGIILKTYTVGDKVIWGGKVWSNLTGNIGTSTDKYNLDTINWSEISYNPIDYEIVYDEIVYDIDNDIIVSRSEKDNIIETSKYFITSSGGLSNIKDFQFGNIFTTKGNSNIRISNSYLDNLNSRLESIKNVECLQGSKIYNITSHSPQYITNLNLTNSSIYNIVLDGSDLTGINMNNSIFRDNIYVDAYNRNLTMDNSLIHSENVIVSFISNIHTIDSTISSSKIIDSLELSYFKLNNGSTITGMNIINVVNMTNIELNSSNISILTLTDVPNFKDITINDGSLIELTSETFNFENITINNVIVDRTLTPLTANEVGKEYKGDLELTNTVDTFYIKQGNEVKEISLSDLQVLVGEPTFDENITVSLSGGKTFGRFVNGEPIPSMGKTAREVIKMSVTQTLFSSITEPSIGISFTNFNTTQEIGTLLSNITVTATANRGSYSPVYAPSSVTTILNGRLYTVSNGGSITYDGIGYNSGQNFTGTAITTFAITSGSPLVKHFYDGTNFRVGVFTSYAFSGRVNNTSPISTLTGQSFIVNSGVNQINVVGTFGTGNTIFDSTGALVPTSQAGYSLGNPRPSGSTNMATASLTGAYYIFRGWGTGVIPEYFSNPTTLNNAALNTHIRNGSISSKTFLKTWNITVATPTGVYPSLSIPSQLGQPEPKTYAWFAYDGTLADVSYIKYVQFAYTDAVPSFSPNKKIVNIDIPNNAPKQYKLYYVTFESAQALVEYAINIP